jgi:hypothetical protein
VVEVEDGITVLVQQRCTRRIRWWRRFCSTFKWYNRWNRKYSASKSTTRKCMEELDASPQESKFTGAGGGGGASAVGGNKCFSQQVEQEEQVQQIVFQEVQ